MILRQHLVRRRGTVLPLVAISLTALLGMIALGVDLGVVAVARTQCQAAADIAALAGCRQLNGQASDNNVGTVGTAPGVNPPTPPSGAQGTALQTAEGNSVLGQPITYGQVTVSAGVYRYSSSTQQFTPDMSGTKAATESWTAIQVAINTSQPMYFANIFGMGPVNVGATALAVHRPRDVAIVLDFSTSMQYSSNVNIRGSTNGGPTPGSMNPDPVYPQFGPWSIFPSSGGANPMMATTGYGDRGGEGHAVSNLTMATQNGPALVNDFLYDSTGSGNYVNAFVVGDPANYNPNLTPVVTPAPSSWTTHPAPALDGDAWPLKRGVTTPSGPSDYASTVQDYLGSTATQTDKTNFENNGYDWDFTANQLKTGTNTFKGYTMGPGYYGKTFYMWPPDPRQAKDWRRLYFGTNDNTQLWDSGGNWIHNGGTTVSLNYPAILAWIKSGPQTLPGNLQSGRVIYYSSIPSDVNISGSSSTDLDKKFWKEYIDFVVGYNSYDQAHSLYGQNSSNTFNGTTFGSTVQISAPPSSGTPPPYMSYTDIPIHPRLHFWFGPLTMIAFLTGKPEYARNWNPGTSHEAHDWHLKAGIQSAIQDIKNNHPNDYASLIYFSTLSQYNTARAPMGQYYTWMTNALWYPYNLIDTNTASGTVGQVSGTMRPYDVNFNDKSQGTIPTANGGTNSSGGIMTAYNQFSSNTGQGFTGRRGAAKLLIFETDGVTHDWYGDGSGNPAPLTNVGAYQSYYTFPGNSDEGVNSNVSSPSKLATVGAVQQLCASTAANPPGYSTARQPVRVHALAFGELFEPYLTNDATAGPMQQCALQFLLNIQLAGGTSQAPNNTLATCWGYPGTPTSGGDGITAPSGGYTTGQQSFKIIVGGYQQRIDLIRQALQRIMQSGVQVALIQ
jgi:hypothetical protein